MTHFDRFLTLLAFIPGVIIFVGTVGLILYYNAMDIYICNYIDLSEVISLSFDTLLSTVALFLILAMILLNDDHARKDFLENRLYITMSNSGWKGRLILYACLLALISAFGLIGYIFSAPNYINAIVFLVLFYILLEINTRIYKKFNAISPYFLSSILIFGLYLFFTGYLIQDELDESPKKYLGTEITTSSKKYISTINNFYAGQTKSFVFIRNLDSLTTLAIPMSEVKLLKIVRH